MLSLKLETPPGAQIWECCQQAQHVANVLGIEVRFVFNDTTLFARRETTADDLLKAYNKMRVRV